MSRAESLERAGILESIDAWMKIDVSCDRIVGAVALLLLSPVLALVALAIKHFEPLWRSLRLLPGNPKSHQTLTQLGSPPRDVRSIGNR